MESLQVCSVTCRCSTVLCVSPTPQILRVKARVIVKRQQSIWIRVIRHPHYSVSWSAERRQSYVFHAALSDIRRGKFLSVSSTAALWNLPSPCPRIPLLQIVVHHPEYECLQHMRHQSSCCPVLQTMQRCSFWQQAFHGLWESAGLKMPIHVQCFRWAILTRKVGQTDLVFGVRSRFISRSVHARLQVSGYSSYDLCHAG